ncbi:MAG: hypothetical protein AAGI28_08005 [Pseudomonadota bacterium]
MQRFLYAGVVGLSLALGGCQDGSEETPNITEAIPLKADETTANDESQSGLSDDLTVQDGSARDGSTSGVGTTSQGARKRSVPDTMATGSNPPDMTQPPAGSKVQRIN